MSLPDNYLRALEIKESPKNVKLPQLEGWNKELPLRPFQARGVAWLYLARRALLADPVGLGKTIQALGLISLLKTVERPYRTIVLTPNYNSEMQWYRETRRFTSLIACPVNGAKSERVSQYAAWWDILLTRYSLLIRDLPYLKQLHFDILIADEASYFRHHDIKTARCIKSLAANADRIVLMDATPIQTSLLDIHSLLETLRMNVFGPVPAFEQRYVRREPVRFRKGSTWIRTSRIVGYKHMKEFKSRVNPFILRRKLAEVEADMPNVQVQNVWLDLLPVQAKFYSAARRGIIELYEAGDRKRMRAHFHHLQYACQPAGSLVLTSQGFRPIETLDSHDWLPVGYGVTGVESHGMKEIIEIKTSMSFPTKYSADHMMPVYMGKGVVILKPVDDLEVGDMLMIPKLQEQSLPFSLMLRCLGPGGVMKDGLAIPFSKLSLLIAEYVGDGDIIRHKSNFAGIRVTFGKRKMHYLDEFVSYVKALGLSTSVSDTTNAKAIRIFNHDLGQWFSEHFREHALGKVIPAWLIQAPLWFIDEFLNRYPDKTTHREHRAWTSGNLAIAQSIILMNARLSRIVTAVKHSSNSIYPNSQPYYYQVIPTTKRWVTRLAYAETILTPVTKINRVKVEEVYGLKTKSRYYNTVIDVHNCDTTLAFVEKTEQAQSVKIDWLMNELERDLRGEKVVIFSKYKVGIDHIMHRLQKAGIGSVKFTGNEDYQTREQALNLFWNDTKTQCMVGTSALERSLNLHCSAYMIMLNQLYNPQRIYQLLGRINRMGSGHKTIFLINLLTSNTIEEKLQHLLMQRAALPNFLFDEKSEIFDHLSDMELMALIQE